MKLKIYIVGLIAVIAAVGCAPRPYGVPTAAPEKKNDGDAIVLVYSQETATFLKKNKEKVAIEKAKDVVKNNLKDPDSAKFKDVEIKSYKDGKLICGYVNAKNSYGGYNGFKPFAASPTQAIIAGGGKDLSSLVVQLNVLKGCGAYVTSD